MRIVNFNYLNQAYLLKKDSGLVLSNKDFEDVLTSMFIKLITNPMNYITHIKVVNSDAANNQTIAIIIVLGLIIAASIFLFT